MVTTGPAPVSNKQTMIVGSRKKILVNLEIIDPLQPLFIVGSPRSGTSLLRLILMSHSEVVIPPECGFMLWLHDDYKFWSLGDSMDVASKARFIKDLVDTKKFETWGLSSRIVSDAILEHQPASYAELCALMYVVYARSLRKTASIWGDKNNYYIKHLPQIDKLYPEARFLHIVRDGRDVACSYREVMSLKMTSLYAPKLPTGIVDIAQEWAGNNHTIGKFLEGVVDNNKKLIRYEHLVRDTDSIISSVFEWLGLPHEPEVKNFYQLNKTEGLEPQQTLEWKMRTLEPISDTTVGRYQKYFTHGEKLLFENTAGAQLEKYGYPL